jgi:hypothetical protein
MTDKRKEPFPKWLFAVLGASGLIATGIFIGIMSIGGITRLHLFQATIFCIFGLLMLRGALSSG